MKQAPPIALRKFTKDDYDELISWVSDAELLMQFAGPFLTYPLTSEQLETNCADVNRSCYAVINADTQETIGHAEIFLTGTSALIGRVLIIPQLQGLGIGKKLMMLLVEISFNELHQQLAELYVFDWNTAAIVCYEKVGFALNKDKQLVRYVNGKTWIAFNMAITKDEWFSKVQSVAIP